MTLKNGFSKCSLFVFSPKENNNMEKALIGLANRVAV